MCGTTGALVTHNRSISHQTTFVTVSVKGSGPNWTTLFVSCRIRQLFVNPGTGNAGCPEKRFVSFAIYLGALVVYIDQTEPNHSNWSYVLSALKRAAAGHFRCTVVSRNLQELMTQWLTKWSVD